ncbi:MAG: flagellar motor protein [Gammaproteobacteria bacterium]|nr:MAG: flagellar motor protein [Gammaproteobacteria bacterium]
MDFLSVIGVILGSAAIFGGSVAKGSGLAALWNGAAFLIVIVGTFAAVLVQVRLQAFAHGLAILRWVFVSPLCDGEELLAKVLAWSQVARKEGLLGLEDLTEEEPDPFIRKGLQLLVDGAEPESIRHIMDLESSSREQFDHQGAKVFESLGIYAPTLGIIGAVMGLMAVMQNLAEPEKLGAGIAAAFVATIYGIASANLLFLPIGNKLKAIISGIGDQRDLIVEGLVGIARGDNPRSIETRLRGYLI